MNYKELQKIAKEVGAAIDVLMLGRHDYMIFTTGELERFVADIEKRTIERCAELQYTRSCIRHRYDKYDDAAAIRKLGEQ